MGMVEVVAVVGRGMRKRRPWRSALAVVLLAAVGSPILVVAQANSDRGAVVGLTAHKVGDLDLLQVRPGVDFVAYRLIVVEPATAAMRQNWRKDINDSRSPARWVSVDDVDAITNQAAASLRAMTQTGFEARGFVAATAPGPGVLRLVPTVTDLDVYAPDTETPGIERYYVRYGGEASLHLDVLDAETGVLLARISDRNIARELQRINRASGAANVFWFEALFRDWAMRCAGALRAVSAT